MKIILMENFIEKHKSIKIFYHRQEKNLDHLYENRHKKVFVGLKKPLSDFIFVYFSVKCSF